MAQVDAWAHYLHVGWREGRKPNAWFDPRAYCVANADVYEAGAEPFGHYLSHGRREQRSLGDKRPSLPAQDVSAYRSVLAENASLDRSVLAELSREHRLYAVFLTARSGSTWLTELARDSGVLGCPQEWFNRDWIGSTHEALGCRSAKALGIRDANEYAREIVRQQTATAPIAGIELPYADTVALAELTLPAFDPEVFHATFYLRRMDLVAQSISLYRSAASGLFHSYQRTPELEAKYRAVQYDPTAIADHLRHLAQDELAFEELFEHCGIGPARFFYEDLVAAPRTVLQRMADVLQPGASVPSVASGSMTRLGDDTSTEWGARFRREAEELVAAIEVARPQLQN